MPTKGLLPGSTFFAPVSRRCWATKDAPGKAPRTIGNSILF